MVIYSRGSRSGLLLVGHWLLLVGPYPGSYSRATGSAFMGYYAHFARSHRGGVHWSARLAGGSVASMLSVNSREASDGMLGERGVRGLFECVRSRPVSPRMRYAWASD